MKVTLSIIMVFLTIFLMIGGFVGCNKEDVLAPEEFAPPTNLRALSKDSEVVLYWDAAPAATADFFVGYRIITKLGTQKVDSVLVGKTKTNQNIQNLTNGQTYTFTIQSVKDNNDVSTAVTLQWGPTQRFSPPAQIYEFASQNPSGLQFSTGSTVSLADPVKKLLADLWIDGRNNTTPSLKSPHELGTGFRTTQFAETNVYDLNAYVEVPPLSSFHTTALTITANRIYFARTHDGHYVRFLVTDIQGSGDDQYIGVTIAYNSGTGAWAKR